MKYLTTMVACCGIAYGATTDPNSPTEHPLLVSTDSSDPRLHFILKGVVQLSGTYYFSIFDNGSQRSKWLSSGEQFNGLTIVKFDAPQKQLIISYQDTHRILALAHANDTPVPILTNTQSHSVATATPAMEIISRRPAAFTASAQNKSAATQLFNTNENRSPLHLDSSSQSPQSLATQQPSNSNNEIAQVSTVVTVDSTVKRSFNNRFGIDKSRLSGAF